MNLEPYDKSVDTSFLSFSTSSDGKTTTYYPKNKKEREYLSGENQTNLNYFYGMLNFQTMIVVSVILFMIIYGINNLICKTTNVCIITKNIAIIIFVVWIIFMISWRYDLWLLRKKLKWLTNKLKSIDQTVVDRELCSPMTPPLH